MELPIDHFRILGVSPSASAEEVLRFFQLRLDRIPHPGFTPEVMAQRSELLRLSADLLCEQKQREEYEKALLNGALGLELSFNREVAGLILLWEGGVAYEAFKLSKKALNPPQTPALGSGREADLALVAALSCKDASLQEQEQRHYASAAELLQEGIQLLQRMGKLPEQRKILERDLERLLPYRILDLLSRDLSDGKAHQEGIELLDNFVLKRGGIEGRNISNSSVELTQNEFELFFQQIRMFLTAQEQVDLFLHWQRRGSADAGFLGAIALVASGFYWRKPEVLQKAKKQLNALNHQGFDAMPLLGCIELLLADVNQAAERFKSSPDKGLKDWLNAYPGEQLAALCHYCRNWLQTDVLLGFRDIEIDAVDLEAWFADRDVQEYVEKIERRGALGIARAGFSFLSGFSPDKNDQSRDSSKELTSQDALTLKSQNSSDLVFNEIPPVDELDKEESTYKRNSFKELILLFENSISRLQLYKLFTYKQTSNNNFFIGIIAFLILFSSGTLIGWQFIRNQSSPKVTVNSSDDPTSKNFDTKEPEQLNLRTKKEDQLGSKSKEELSEIIVNDFDLLIKEVPSKDDIQQLIEAWLSGKAQILSGAENLNLDKVARPSLVKIVREQREKDISLGQSQIIYAAIRSLEIEDQTEKRISVKAILSYRDQRINSSGQIVSETSIPSLKLKYVLGRDKNQWQLLDFSSST
ncbi:MULTISPECIES: ARC6/PARC6 family protein [Prochlorococcus]|uniref:ARC6/PARC6 family protein n=1 Tax=Prochlorococcus TaxID=1218 RepID=UPI0005339C82|nr:MULTISPECIES: ARC6/PARC6 family protein [Prochlorococcus]KGG11999.1 Cell division protein ZipN/Ftn2/Arc6 [Prochlorococcus sp. MIT 0601]